MSVSPRTSSSPVPPDEETSALPVATCPGRTMRTDPGCVIVRCGRCGCMDCLRCSTHHLANDLCLAAREQWEARHAHQRYYTYAQAYEDDLLMRAVAGTLDLTPDPSLVILPVA